MKKKRSNRILSLALSAALCLTLLPAAALAEDDRPDYWWMEYYGMGWQTDEVSGMRFYVDEYCNIHWDVSSGGSTPTDPDTPTPEPDVTPPVDPGPADAPNDTGPTGDPTDPPRREEDFYIENGELIRFDGGSISGTLRIPNGVTRIAPGALSWSEGMTGVVIPDSVQAIGEGAFYHCDLLESVTIPDGVQGIERDTFGGCGSMRSIRLPDSVTRIGEGAFSDCSGLTGINLPDRLTEIGESAFRYCSGLKELTIPDSVTSIGDLAFADCDNLTRITIPDSVGYIGEYTFSGAEDKLTISGDSGSVAEDFAKRHDITFVSIGVSKRNPPKADVPNLDTASSWARESLNAAYRAGLIPNRMQAGYTQAATRAEFCALATALYETVANTQVSGRTTFTDTNDKNVEKMAYLGVVTGVGGGRFDPDGKLTREQAATMLARLADTLDGYGSAQSYANEGIASASVQTAAVTVSAEAPAAGQNNSLLPAGTPTFSDKASISAWAVDAVGRVQAAGIMGGVGNNAFAPQGEYTREQSILTMYRLYELLR